MARDFKSIDSEYAWFIRRINEHRVRMHMSLDDMSLVTHIDKANLSRIFSCKSVPSVKNLIRILDAVDLRIALKSGYLYPFL